MKTLFTRVLIASSLIAGGSIFSAPSQAALVTVDPDSYSNHTNISSSFSGLTLSTVGGSNTNVYAVASGLSTTGSNVFGTYSTSAGYGVNWGGSSNDGLKAVFAVATDYVQIDIIGNSSGNSDRGQLTAYDSSNNVIATVTTNNLGSGDYQTLSITQGTASIAYIIATGTNNRAISLDNLKYTVGSVPEPSAIVMLGCGAVAIFGVSRRRRPRG
ncbi:PEP-CTERM sorting domain-containing protein [Paludisphaera rhizosphaerae]|uniref:PEP-CTERM sorting domain-containing protein n=1 Tax=Paludisphaera rhizosphaerae TaxID=2711216 RepID=UPI0013EDCF76|nr:PEP-CTERM sorting domain-containing protein [Paludisphaera rhizosphaerae]